MLNKNYQVNSSPKLLVSPISSVVNCRTRNLELSKHNITETENNTSNSNKQNMWAIIKEKQHIPK